MKNLFYLRHTCRLCLSDRQELVVPMAGMPIGTPNFQVPLYASGIYGLIILVVMLFRPEGLLPSRRRAAELHEGVHDEPLYDHEMAGA